MSGAASDAARRAASSFSPSPALPARIATVPATRCAHSTRGSSPAAFASATASYVTSTVAGSSTEGQEAQLQWSELEPHAAQAIAAAMAELSVRQRTLVRLHYVEGVSAQALAKMYSVHRATTTRWLVEARERLLELVQTRLRDSLELDTASLHSLQRTLAGGLELSLPALLEPKPSKGPDEP